MISKILRNVPNVILCIAPNALKIWRINVRLV